MASKYNTVIHSSTGPVVIGDGAKIRINRDGKNPPSVQIQDERPQRMPRNTPVQQESSEDDDLRYKINTGYVLIINNQRFPSRQDFERRGSEFDVQNMKQFFDDVGLRPVQVLSDLDASQMRKELKDVSEKDFSKYDCFICVILSHGTREGVYGIDHDVIQMDYITSLFRKSECPTLEGKPKLFFIQACRGSDQDLAPESDSEPLPSFCPTLPADSDFLICYASSPGLKSYREPTAGSWFISTVSDVFTNYADREHVMDMMLRVNKKVASYWSSQGHKQMPSEVCMLTKKVYFNAPQSNR